MDDKSLTPEEVAEELRVSRFTVYDLIKRGDLQAFRVGRKMRILRTALYSFTTTSAAAVPGTAQAAAALASPPDAGQQLRDATRDGFVVCGQDIVLDILVRHLDQELPEHRFLRSHDGSCNALWALYHGRAQIASTHLWDADSNDYNTPYARRLLPGCNALLVNVLYRYAGFYVAPDNPKALHTWQDLKRPNIRMINRELGSGVRVLLDEKLKQLKIDTARIPGYNQVEASHPAIASAVARGHADVGVGVEKVARQVEGISFVPLQKERYDIVLRKEDAELEPFRTVLAVLRSAEFREEIAAIGGYDVSDMGRIMAEI
ncbi:MAG: helix-turn-helix domain-containing protein [Spirochaetaceae bacterium]|nr:MAG: helix-turn-helix domain-containing protein [Spirochaetaceae bacterium]